MSAPGTKDMKHKHEASLDYPTRCNQCGCQLVHNECESEVSRVELSDTPTFQTKHKPGRFETLWQVVIWIGFLVVCVFAAIWLGKFVWGLRLLILAIGPFVLSFNIFLRESVPYPVTRVVAGLGSFYVANSILFHTFASRVASAISLGDFGQITFTLAAALGIATWYFSGRIEVKLRHWTLLLAAGSSGWFLFKSMLIVLQLSPWLTHGMTDFMDSGAGP